MKDYHYFTNIFGSQYPISHALWRTFEAQSLIEHNFVFPLLDLGCGDGFFLETLLNVPQQTPPLSERVIFGIDPWKEQCDIARRRGLYFQVDCADASHMPYANNSFEFVFSNSVIEHIADVDLVLKEVSRVLKSGGHFLFSAPTNALGEYFFWRSFFEKLGLKRLAQWYRNNVNTTFVHHNLFNKEEWTKRLAVHNLIVEDFHYTLCPRSESTWDALLVPSYIQLCLKNWFHLKKIPFARANERLLRWFVNKYATAEESCIRGGNCIIYCRIQK